MRQVLSLFLTFCMALTPVAQVAAAPAIVHAAAAPLLKHLDHGPQSLKSAVERALVAKPADFAIGIGHGLLLVMTLTGIDFLFHEITNKGIDPRSLTPAKLEEMASQVSTQVVNNGELWTSLVGSQLLGTAAQKPVEAIAKLMVDAASRYKFSEMIKTSMLSTISFVGWEFGAQLWVEAGQLVEDPADYKRLQSAFGVSKGALYALLKVHSTPQDQTDLRLAHQMIGNILTILFYDGDLLSRWFNDTWRLRVMTGEFTTWITATLVGVAVGSAILPVAGSFVGFMFGTIGAAMAPQKMKDSISFSLQGVRQHLSSEQLDSNEASVRVQFSRLGRIGFGIVTDDDRTNEVAALLKTRHGIRETFVNASIDRIQLAIKILKSDRSGRTARRTAHAKLAEAFAVIVDMYMKEDAALTRLTPPAGAELPGAMNLLINGEQIRVRALADFWSNTGTELKNRTGEGDASINDSTLDTSAASLLQFIDTLHLRGFTEASVL